MGFCLFNNVAIAAAPHAIEGRGLKRVAIVDFDVHHGNGTQDAFYADPRVLYVTHPPVSSLSRNRGGERGAGEGAGLGATLNLPLPGGCGDEEYLRVYREVCAPVVRRFGPPAPAGVGRVRCPLRRSAGRDAAQRPRLLRDRLHAAGAGRRGMRGAGRLCPGGWLRPYGAGLVGAGLHRHAAGGTRSRKTLTALARRRLAPTSRPCWRQQSGRRGWLAASPVAGGRTPRWPGGGREGSGGGESRCSR